MALIQVIVAQALPLDTLTYRCDQRVEVGARVVVPIGQRNRVVAIVRSLDAPTPTKGTIRNVIEVIDHVPLVGERELRFADWMAGYYMCRSGQVWRALCSVLFGDHLDGLSCRYTRPKRVKKKILPTIVDKCEPLLEPAPLMFGIDKQVTLIHELTPVDLASVVGSLTESGSTVLLLAPTAQMADEYHTYLSRFFDSVALCTVDSSQKKRAALLVDISVGLAPRVVVGTRSALLLPYARLSGVVVVDEGSFHYKAAHSPQISVRDSALVLSAMHSARAVLTAAIPSVESYYNAQHGQWGYQRTEPSTKKLRKITLERGKELISKYLQQRITETLQAGDRVVLMQNRRGMASFVECTSCREVPQCPCCSTSLTLHSGTLNCHYCGHSELFSSLCSVCGSKMEPKGRGTQQIEQQLSELFPAATIVRVDSDAKSRSITAGCDHWDIVVGTKMVVENIDWSPVKIAAILNVDNLLCVADFRSGEDTFRLVGTMAFRCRELGAELIVQSSRLDYRCVNDALEFRLEQFYDQEIAQRRDTMFPPHSRMVRISFRGEQIGPLMGVAQDGERALRSIFADHLSPLHQPLVERQDGQYIVELLLKIGRGSSSARAKELIISTLSPIRGVASKAKVSILYEVDPR